MAGRTQKRRFQVIGALSAAALLSVAACSSPSDKGDGGEEIEIEIATWGSPEHISITSFIPAFEDALAERSDGRITVNHVPGGSLAEDVDMPLAIPRGTVEMGWTTMNGWSGVVPSMSIFDSPLVGSLSMEELNSALEDDSGLGGLLEADLEEAGVEMLAWAQLGPAAIVTGNEVRTPGDLSDSVIRTYSASGEKLVEAAGASAASLAFAEVYTGIQRGSVDGAHVGLQGIASQRLYEVADYAMVPSSHFGTAMSGWPVNKEWFDSLEMEDQEIIREAAAEAGAVSREAIIEDRDTAAATYEEEGMEFFTLTANDPEDDAWADLVAPLAADDEESFDPKLVEALQPSTQ